MPDGAITSGLTRRELIKTGALAEMKGDEHAAGRELQGTQPT